MYCASNINIIINFYNYKCEGWLECRVIWSAGLPRAVAWPWCGPRPRLYTAPAALCTQTEVIARNLSYPSSGDWRAMLPRYVTSGQFSSSVEFLMTYKSAFYACIMHNIFYCLSNLMMICWWIGDWVKPELERSHGILFHMHITSCILQYFHFGYLHEVCSRCRHALQL